MTLTAHDRAVIASLAIRAHDYDRMPALLAERQRIFYREVLPQVVGKEEAAMIERSELGEIGKVEGVQPFDVRYFPISIPKNQCDSARWRMSRNSLI